MSFSPSARRIDMEEKVNKNSAGSMITCHECEITEIQRKNRDVYHFLEQRAGH